MTYSKLFDSGFKTRNEGHFAAIVRVAMAKGNITNDEQKFLDRLASRLNINVEKYKLILKNYDSYPINPPASYDLRLERLYDLVRMIHVDDINGKPETLLLNKISVGLGFHSKDVTRIIEKACELVSAGTDLDNFMHQIKHMDKFKKTA